MNHKASLLSIVLLLPTLAAIGVRATELPAEFRYGRVFVLPETASGRALEFYTDTGGGWNMIAESVAGELNLEPIGQVEGKEGPHELVPMPEFAEGRGIPSAGDPDFNQGGLVAVPPEFGLSHEGFLGGRWFANGVWQFDYPGQSLRFLGREPVLDPGDEHTVPLGFQVDGDGERTTHFPRINVAIAGVSLDMLFDTGAHTEVTAAAAEHFGMKAGADVAGSFISRAVYDRWREEHPGWLVVNEGNRLGERVFPMIRVPAVRIAGLEAGPVWFAARPEGTFEEWMSGMMDKPIVGAIGGSAFQYFRITIDYPAALARFELPR